MAKLVVESFAVLLLIGVVQLSSGRNIDLLGLGKAGDLLTSDLNKSFGLPGLVARSSASKYCLPKVCQYLIYYYPSPSNATSLVYIDGDSTRFAFREISGNDGSWTEQIFLYHPETHIVDMYDFDSSKCVHERDSDDYEPICFPDSTKLIGNFTIGMAPNAIRTQLLSTTVQGMPTKMLVTEKETIPIVASDKIESWYYSDVSLSITDPTVFTPPSYCK